MRAVMTSKGLGSMARDHERGCAPGPALSKTPVKKLGFYDDDNPRRQRMQDAWCPTARCGRKIKDQVELYLRLFFFSISLLPFSHILSPSSYLTPARTLPPTPVDLFTLPPSLFTSFIYSAYAFLQVSKDSYVCHKSFLSHFITFSTTHLPPGIWRS